MEAADRGIAESGSSRLSTLMIDIPGDLKWDLPCVQQASYLEGGPLMWMLPLYLHVNKKSDDDDDVYSDNMPEQTWIKINVHGQVDPFITTLRTGLFPIAGCLVSFLLFLCFIEISVFNGNSVDTDQRLHFVVSDLAVHCLPIKNCQNWELGKNPGLDKSCDFLHFFFYKRGNFCDFLFAFLHINPLLKSQFPFCGFPA